MLVLCRLKYVVSRPTMTAIDVVVHDGQMLWLIGDIRAQRAEPHKQPCQFSVQNYCSALVSLSFGIKFHEIIYITVSIFIGW